MTFDHNSVLRAGIELRRLTNTESFELAVNMLKETFKDRIVTSGLGEKQEREEAYQQFQALEELIGTINSLVQYAERDALNANTDNE